MSAPLDTPLEIATALRDLQRMYTALGDEGFAVIAGAGADAIETLTYRLSHADDAISVLEGQLRGDTGLTPIHQHTWYLKPDTDELIAYCVGCGLTRGPFTITMPPVQRAWWNTSAPDLR